MIGKFQEYLTLNDEDKVIVIADENDADYVVMESVIRDSKFDKRNVRTTLESALVIKTLFDFPEALDKKRERAIKNAYQELGLDMTYENFDGLIKEVALGYVSVYNGHTLESINLVYDNKYYNIEKVSLGVLKGIILEWDKVY